MAKRIQRKIVDRAETIEGGQFEEGDSAIYYHPGYEGHLERVTVTDAYRSFVVVGDRERAGYRRRGYGIKLRSGDTVFAAPWMLRDAPNKPAHIRLVAEVKEHAQETKCPHCGK